MKTWFSCLLVVYLFFYGDISHGLCDKAIILGWHLSLACVHWLKKSKPVLHFFAIDRGVHHLLGWLAHVFCQTLLDGIIPFSDVLSFVNPLFSRGIVGNLVPMEIL